jgi:hypothetical protein
MTSEQEDTMVIRSSGPNWKKTACAMLAILVVFSMAGSVAAKQTRDDGIAASVACFRVYASAVDRGTLVCLSDHGNIVQYTSPNVMGATYEHIGVGVFSEGYVLCYNTPAAAVLAFDTGSVEANFGAPVNVIINAVSHSTTRPAPAGVELRQLFTFSGINKALTVNMRVTNNGLFPISRVVLRRQVDFDTDTGGANGWANFLNRHAADTNDGVKAWNDKLDAPVGKEAHGMILRHRQTNPANLPHVAKVTELILDNTCNPPHHDTLNEAGGPYPRHDHGDTIQYILGTIGPKQFKEVEVQYERY